MTITRRSLLTGLTTGAAAGLAMGAMPAKAANPCSVPEAWDQTWDVIVIGSGGAGMAAGITAKEAGAKTIILEKMPFPGGNTAVCGGGINAAVPEDAKAAGVEDSPELHAQQTFAAGDCRAAPELVKTLTEGAPQSVEWLKRIGVKFRPGIYQIYGGLWPRCHTPVGQRGIDYIKACLAHGEKIGLEVLTGHKVTRIIHETPTSGRVLGVEVEFDGKKQNWRALKGVVAAAGGFSANAEMCAFFDPRLARLNTTNLPCSTGEVLRSIQDINGLAVGMDSIQCTPAKAPGLSSNANIFQAIEYTIFVNKDGNRFVAEDGRRDVIRDAFLAQRDQVVYQLTDVDGFDAHNTIYNEANHRALKNGVLFAADTIEDAAAKAGIPPDVLKKTVDDYNAIVAAKKDPMGRMTTTLVHQIVKPPFYIGPTGMCRHHTMGGARINTQGQVLDRNGRVIPGLYAAGEVTGGIHGSNRVGGNAVADIFTFGRIAGQSAAAG